MQATVKEGRREEILTGGDTSHYTKEELWREEILKDTQYAIYCLSPNKNPINYGFKTMGLIYERTRTIWQSLYKEKMCILGGKGINRNPFVTDMKIISRFVLVSFKITL